MEVGGVCQRKKAGEAQSQVANFALPLSRILRLRALLLPTLSHSGTMFGGGEECVHYCSSPPSVARGARDSAKTHARAPSTPRPPAPSPQQEHLRQHGLLDVGDVLGQARGLARGRLLGDGARVAARGARQDLHGHGASWSPIPYPQRRLRAPPQPRRVAAAVPSVFPRALSTRHPPSPPSRSSRTRRRSRAPSRRTRRTSCRPRSTPRARAAATLTLTGCARC